MRNTIQTLAILALVMVGASTPVRAQAWAEKMFNGSVTHDFGTQPRGAQLQHSFGLTNIYAVPMEITSIKVGCGCVTATAAKRILQPRESTTIDVVMDTKRFAGPKTVGVRVTVGPNFISSAELRVTGNSRGDIVLNPGQVNFGLVARGQSPSQALDVEYAGALAFQITEVISKDLPCHVQFKESYRRPGAVGYRLVTTLKPDASIGTHKHTVFLKTNDPATPMVAMLIEATVQPAVNVSPNPLSLGVVRADTPLIRKVVIKGGQPFRVTGLVGLGQGIELGAPLNDRDSVVQFLTFKCQFDTAGAFKRDIEIKTTAQDPPVTVTVEGTVVK